MMMGSGEAGLGWRVGTFALETFVPKDAELTNVEVWDAYLAWCKVKAAVPLAYNEFYLEFEKIVHGVGIGRRQVGAHVAYNGLGFKLDKGP